MMGLADTVISNPGLDLSTRAATFGAMVKAGILRERGMPPFEELNSAELKGLQHYIRRHARQAPAAVEFRQIEGVPPCRCSP